MGLDEEKQVKRFWRITIRPACANPARRISALPSASRKRWPWSTSVCSITSSSAMALPAFPNKVWFDRGFEPAGDLFGLERTADVVALHVIAIHLSEQIANRERLDALGDHF